MPTPIVVKNKAVQGMNILRLLCLIFMISCLFLGWRIVGHQDGWASYQDLRQRRDALMQHISKVEENNIELSREIRRLTSDREYLECVIRLEMHYLRPDEVLYIPHNEAFRSSP